MTENHSFKAALPADNTWRIKAYFYIGLFWGFVEALKIFLLQRYDFASAFEAACLFWQALLIYVLFFMVLGLVMQLILKKEITYLLIGTGLFLFIFHSGSQLFTLNVSFLSKKRLALTLFTIILAYGMTLAVKKIAAKKFIMAIRRPWERMFRVLLGLGLMVTLLYFFKIHYSIGMGKTRPPEGYNVLFITIDTLRNDYLGGYGHDYIETPHIDKLASEGVLFKECITQSSITNPAHTSIFTSTYVSNHGVKDNSGYKLKDEFITLAEILREKGFMTAAFVSGWPLKAYISGLDQGFLYYDHKFLPYPALNDQVLKLGLMHLGYRTLFHLNKNLYLNLNERQARWVNRSFISWLSRHKDKKWFGWLHYYDPHASYNAPEPFHLKYDPQYKGPATGSVFKLWRYNNGKISYSARDLKHLQAIYAGEVSYVDYNLGQIFEYLKISGLYDKTIIILTADHGESLGGHNYFGHEQYLYEDILKVPLILKGNFLPRRLDHTVRHIDIMPTLLDILSIAIPKECRGRSLKPYLDGHELTPLTEVFSECFRRGRVCRSVRTKNYKLIENIGRGYELYDLDKDPEELHNIFNQEAETTIELKEKLARFAKENIPPQEQAPKLSQDAIESLKSLGYLQ